MPEKTEKKVASIEGLRRELNDVIIRWEKESDLSFGETLGAIEMVKVDLVNLWNKL